MLGKFVALLFTITAFSPCMAQVDQTYLSQLIEHTQKKLDQKDSCETPQEILLKDPHFVGKTRSFDLREPLPRFDSPDGAAKAFGSFVRKYFKQQFVEYCAEITKDKSGSYSFPTIYRGSPGGCNVPTTSQNRVGVIHTHPEDETNKNDLSSSFQVFSANDIEYAEQNKIDTLYMVAPGGHILKYEKGSSVCRNSKVLNPYKFVQRPRSSAKGKLLIGSQDFVTFPNAVKPSYCP